MSTINMQICLAILNVSITILELYLESTTDFAFVQLFFGAGEIVLPNLSYCIFIGSMYAKFLWSVRKFSSSTFIWIAGRLLLKPLWILLISCSWITIRWISSVFNQMAVKFESTQQIWLTYMSFALSVAITYLLFSKRTVSDFAPNDTAHSAIVWRRNKVITYRITKWQSTLI